MTTPSHIRRAQQLAMLVLAAAAAALLVASCGRGAVGETCSSDGDCQSQLRCCSNQLGSTCKTPLSGQCPTQSG